MNYISITEPDINNGLGCRCTIWFAGCPFKCKGCHNKETWEYNQGKSISDEDGVFYETIYNIFRNKPYLAGITLSGGDPLGGKSDKDLIDLLYLCMWFKGAFPDKNIWIYSGDYYENVIKHPIKKQILDYCDVIVDGPFEIEKRDIRLPFRGSTNQRIIDLHNKKDLKIE